MSESHEEQMDLPAMMASVAATHVRTAHNALHASFDFTPESLELADELISTHFPNGTVLEDTVTIWGAYVGETIRRNLGGIWSRDDENGAFLTDVAGVATIYPLSWAHKRFANGEEDSLSFKYKVCLKTAQDAGATFPEPDLPTAEELEAMRADSGPDGNELNALPSAIFAVFLVVATADGKLDKKELNKLTSLLQKPQQYSSPLFQASLAVVPEVIEPILSELSGSFLNALPILSSAAELLDRSLPAEAASFKQNLMAFGRTIAASSGGFLGLGSKIGKGEKAALRLVATMLGLEPED